MNYVKLQLAKCAIIPSNTRQKIKYKKVRNINAGNHVIKLSVKIKSGTTLVHVLI